MQPGCGTEGDSDLLGLGARLGSYLQWLALILASILDPQQVVGIVKSIYMFQFAFLIAMIWTLSAGLEESYDIHVFIVTVFGAGGGLSRAIMFNTDQGSRVTRALGSSLLLAFASCSLFFWASGLNKLNQAPCSRIFMFAKVDLHGPVRYFGLVASVLAVIASVSSLVQLCFGLLSNWDNRSTWLLNCPSNSNLSRAWRSAVFRLLVSVAQILTFVTLVLAVELAVAWNNITGVNDVKQTGQLIPLIVGAGALLQVVWTCYFRRKPNPYQ